MKTNSSCEQRWYRSLGSLTRGRGALPVAWEERLQARLDQVAVGLVAPHLSLSFRLEVVPLATRGHRPIVVGSRHQVGQRAGADVTAGDGQRQLLAIAIRFSLHASPIAAHAGVRDRDAKVGANRARTRHRAATVERRLQGRLHAIELRAHLLFDQHVSTSTQRLAKLRARDQLADGRCHFALRQQSSPRRSTAVFALVPLDVQLVERERFGQHQSHRRPIDHDQTAVGQSGVDRSHPVIGRRRRRRRLCRLRRQ